jgi:hypothetical protein
MDPDEMYNYKVKFTFKKTSPKAFYPAQCTRHAGYQQLSSPSVVNTH